MGIFEQFVDEPVDESLLWYVCVCDSSGWMVLRLQSTGVLLRDASDAPRPCRKSQMLPFIYLRSRFI